MLTADMSGKTVLVTGANSGIGFVSARELACRGGHVILACRRDEAAIAARQRILEFCPDAEVSLLRLDLASLSSVRKAAAEVRQRWPVIDVLINNAGIAQIGRRTSEDGFELTLATNHLGPFLLTQLLLPALRDDGGRIVNVASDAHRIGRIHFDDLNLEQGYSVLKAYAQSKMANIHFTRELATRMEARGISVFAVHPGNVNTNIWPRNRWYEKLFSAFLGLFMIGPEKGAETIIWLATSPELEGENGLYYKNCQRHRPSARARNTEDAQRLWQWTEQVLDLS